MLGLVRRPHTFDADVAGEICRRLCNGQSLREICRDIDMPEINVVFSWIALNDSFATQYARARGVQADVFADEIIALADECRMAEVRTLKEGPMGVETRIVTSDAIERSKLQIEARKWAAGRMAPNKWGDRLAHQMLDEHVKPARGGITLIIDGAPQQIE